MKWSIAILLCFILSTVLALTVEESKEKVKKAHEKCNGDAATKLDPEEKKAYKSSKVVGPSLKAHALCVSKTLGWQHPDGKIDKTSVKEKISSFITDKEQADKIYSECLVDHDDEKDTAHNLLVCYGRHFGHKH
uniref:Pheromone binding protein 14 n=1 Tax=Cyrtotrachelus buqueti TaxID=1892066 RepID=A0A1L3KPV1_9CUCU|nr:pheromone binding protein 14 [Cyrtotrachelus buqueti]